MRHLLADMGSAELAEWRAYERLSGPLGGARGDVQAALIATVIAAVNRNKGQRSPRVDEFLPRWDKGVVRKSPEELFQTALQANFALKGGFQNSTP